MRHYVSKDYKWYRMQTDPTVIGYVTNQHATMEPGYASNARNSVYNMPWYDLCEIDPYFGKIELLHRAKLTDFVSSVVLMEPPYLVSVKAREVLETCKLPPHQFFPVDLYHRGEKHSYFCMHIPRMWETLEHVDYTASQFSLRNVMPPKKLAELAIKSANDLRYVLQDPDAFMKLHGLEVPPSVCAESYTMTNGFLENRDIFNVPRIDPATYFSHSLRKKLEQYNLEGLSCRVPSGFTGFHMDT